MGETYGLLISCIYNSLRRITFYLLTKTVREKQHGILYWTAVDIFLRISLTDSCSLYSSVFFHIFFFATVEVKYERNLRFLLSYLTEDWRLFLIANIVNFSSFIILYFIWISRAIRTASLPSAGKRPLLNISLPNNRAASCISRCRPLNLCLRLPVRGFDSRTFLVSSVLAFVEKVNDQKLCFGAIMPHWKYTLLKNEGEWQDITLSPERCPSELIFQ